MYDLIVIGAGPGGYDAAAHAGQMGKKVALVEQAMGGRHLPQRRLHTGQGLPAVLAPLPGVRRGQALRRGDRRLPLRHAGRGGAQEPHRRRRWSEGWRDCSSGRASRSSTAMPAWSAATGSRWAARSSRPTNILLATGSAARGAPHPRDRRRGVLDSTSVFELAKVPSRVAIIGGGYIGLEFATFFSEIGAEVGGVRDASPDRRRLRRGRLRPAPTCAQAVRGDLQPLLPGGRASRAARSATTTARAQNKTYAADRVLNATGRAPVVEAWAWPRSASTSAPGAYGSTTRARPTCPALWACGDVTGQYMLAHVATREGHRGRQLDVRPSRPGPL